MKTRSQNRAGYTLVEAMMVVTILGVVAIIGPRLLTGMTQFFNQSLARTDIQRDIRVALDTMNRTIRQASAATVTVSQDTGQPPYSKVSFTTVDGKSVTYKQSGRKLLQVVGSAQTVLVNSIEYLAFTYPQTDENTVVSISVTLQKKTFSGRSTALQMAITKVRVMNP
ncbi:MAG: prepilin-type N-terminal cleavage/methylation domain-containing protein [Elusimicrobia bacterium]|nr:prepilin-type N-terminal cleavage/methylation domain-containing protein [Elusimicrobiota bacterium]